MTTFERNAEVADAPGLPTGYVASFVLVSVLFLTVAIDSGLSFEPVH